MSKTTRLRYAQYHAPTGPEWMTVHGDDRASSVIILSPLFNELNYTRAITVAIARSLADAGFTSFIPDLPGTGESPLELSVVSWADWLEAARAVTQSCTGSVRPHIVALRGGALLDHFCDAASWWRLAPVTGAQILRQLERAHSLGSRERKAATLEAGAHKDLVGYRLDPALYQPLASAEPITPGGALRTKAFDGAGAAPWRRAEPSGDPALARAMTDDILAWIRTCDR